MAAPDRGVFAVHRTAMAPLPMALTAIEAISMMLLGGTTQTEAHPTALDLAIAVEAVTLALALSGLGRPRRLSDALAEEPGLTTADLLARIGRDPLPLQRLPARDDTAISPSWLSPHAPRARPRWRDHIST